MCMWCGNVCISMNLRVEIMACSAEMQDDGSNTKVLPVQTAAVFGECVCGGYINCHSHLCH